jgi:hypothetical protein
MARYASQPSLPQSPAFGGNMVGPMSGLFLPNTNIGQAVAQGRRRPNPAGQVGPLRPGLATIQGVQQAAQKAGSLQLNPVFVQKLLSLGGEKVSEVQVASGVSAPSAGHSQRRNTAGAGSKRRPTTVHSAGRSTMGRIGQSAQGLAPQMATPMAAPRPAGPGLGMPGLGAMKLAAPLGGAMLPPAMPKPVGQPGPTQSALAAQGPQPMRPGGPMPQGQPPPGAGGGGSPQAPPGGAFPPDSGPTRRRTHGAHAGQRVALQQAPETGPVQRARAAAAVEPLPPAPPNLPEEPRQGPRVARHPVVRVVAA